MFYLPFPGQLLQTSRNLYYRQPEATSYTALAAHARKDVLTYQSAHHGLKVWLITWWVLSGLHIRLKICSLLPPPAAPIIEMEGLPGRGVQSVAHPAPRKGPRSVSSRVPFSAKGTVVVSYKHYICCFSAAYKYICSWMLERLKAAKDDC